MPALRRPVVASLFLLVISGMLWSTSAAAQADEPINVRGYLDVGSPNRDGPLILVGDRDGFTFSSTLNFRDFVVGPNTCVGDPNACTPESR